MPGCIFICPVCQECYYSAFGVQNHVYLNHPDPTTPLEVHPYDFHDVDQMNSVFHNFSNNKDDDIICIDAFLNSNPEKNTIPPKYPPCISKGLPRGGSKRIIF